MLSEISTFGSCTSRNIFNSSINENYKQFFNINHSIESVNLISLMSKPIKFDETLINSSDNYDNTCVKEDLSKKYTETLRNMNLDYIIIDTYFDVFQGIIQYENDSFISDSERIRNCDYYHSVKELPKLNIHDNSEEYFELWKDSCTNFFNIINTNKNHPRVILNCSRSVYRYMNNENEIVEVEEFKEIALKSNKYRDMLDKYILENYDVETLTFDKNTLSDINHIFSLHPAHYEKKYYQKKTEQINEIISRNNIDDDLNIKIRELTRQNLIKEMKINSLKNHINDLKDNSLKKEDDLKDNIENILKNYTSLDTKLRLANYEHDRLNKELEKTKTENKKLKTENQLNKELEKTKTENKKLKTENQSLKNFKIAVNESTSWNITRPLRKSRNIIRKTIPKFVKKFKNPKISVIIPVYNVENYIERCLNSIINQTLKDIEIICINDGSTDNSLNILTDYANKDNRITIITQNNQGAGSARNRGLNISKGKYIYFIDGDDFIEINTLKKLYNIAEEKSCDLIIFKTHNFYDETNIYFDDEYHSMNFLTPFENTLFHYSQLEGDLSAIDVTLYTKLYKRDLVSNLRFREGVIFEDNLFTFEYIFNTEQIFFYNKTLHHRCVRKESVMTSASKNFIDSLEVFNGLIDMCKKYDYYEIIKEELFMRKFKVLHNRVTQINPQYKDYFFNLIKSDTLEKQNEYNNEIDFKKLDERTKVYYKYFIESKNYEEFKRNIKYFYENKTK